MFEEESNDPQPADAPEATSADAGGDSGWAVPGVHRPASARAPVPLPQSIADLQAAVAGLDGWQPGALDGEQALACAGVLLAVEQVVVSARTRCLTDIEARHLHRLADARTTAGWLRQEGHTVPAAQLTLAKRLSRLPLLADELASGRLTVAIGQRVQSALAALQPHLDRADGLIDGQPADEALYGVIVHGVRGLCCRACGGRSSDDPRLADLVHQLEEIFQTPGSQLARLEAAFVVLATELVAAQASAMLPAALAELVDSLLPAQLEERNRRGEIERGLSLTRKHDGSGWRVQGDLDLETGERAFTVLSAELRRDPDNPTDTAQAEQLREQGLDPYDSAHRLPEHVRPRSRRERMHDALSRALGRYLADGLGGEHDKHPVQVVVTATADGLEGAPGSLAAHGGSGTALPQSLARRWTCGAALTRFVLGLGGRVLEVSHTERTLKAHERRALHLQAGGRCQRRGCPRSSTEPGTLLHPHHADPWARSGSTSLHDTALLCDSCHNDVHHDHVITLGDGRRLGPNGWVT